jgi:hypothetical protein
LKPVDYVFFFFNYDSPDMLQQTQIYVLLFYACYLFLKVLAPEESQSLICRKPVSLWYTLYGTAQDWLSVQRHCYGDSATRWIPVLVVNCNKLHDRGVSNLVTENLKLLSNPASYCY